MPKYRIHSGAVFFRHRPSSHCCAVIMESVQLVLSQLKNVLMQSI